jgi:3',5'-cyclic AMP phosphodiesterase CpdA
MTDRKDELAANRRGLLKCMAWGGTGLVWTMSGGAASSLLLGSCAEAKPMSGFSFVQISDSHIGFNKPPNPDARATFREAVAKLKALPVKPDFVIHTGDVSQLSRENEFDDADQILKESGLEAFHVPGEHDVLDDDQPGKAFLARNGKGTKGDGWYSFDHKGVHFVALVNVLSLKAGGAGSLGADQLAWLEQDLKGRPSSTPIVVFAHVPLWTVYKEWGWGTDDAEQALKLLNRFGSVTVLNGHIHQLQQKVEGNMRFYTARSTAFPQPAPGTAASPGPMKDVPADKLRGMLGLRSVSVVSSHAPLTVVDSALDA